jgi:sortase A
VRGDGRGWSLQWLERALLVLGLVCVGYYGYRSVGAETFQREQTAAFTARLHDDENASASKGVIALLEIPRLKLSSPVLSGDDDKVLDIAIGHLPDTPRPWEAGNSALAAHRDGLFRLLRHVRTGDIVRLRTEHGDFEYEVRETRIVPPTDLSVLRPTDQRVLTLITCYPFSFIGSAPERFVVRANALQRLR